MAPAAPTSPMRSHSRAQVVGRRTQEERIGPGITLNAAAESHGNPTIEASRKSGSSRTRSHKEAKAARYGIGCAAAAPATAATAAEATRSSTPRRAGRPRASPAPPPPRLKRRAQKHA